MDFLIKAYWYQADAHKLGINITDAQVQKALDTAKKAPVLHRAQYQRSSSQSGQTTQDILFRVRVNQIYQKLTAQAPHRRSPPAAIADLLHQPQVAVRHAREPQHGDRPDQDPGPGQRGQGGAAEAARAWDAVAKKYSIDPTTKNKGGVLNGVTAGQQDAALTKAAFAAPVNKLDRPGQGPVRLLRDRGDQGQAGHPAVAGASPAR